ncbi:MAG: T9SS type A sorting domain-containing protein [Chitinophagales bacterium]|nr:T9SS type A sorting domain-containing protein [Saprospiraceae bacterium]MBK7110032.1 T9SS type A sorting domain-containing protein [Bacteroidota bacterium]MBP7399716.1 T9SS type A sorting domain-containing protein [Chitinophagales bacterium]MBK8487244.1 T9SS type A sorting domain-containing protein [Bacteroidota bacterium]MBK8680630.1 T9SS type A sorting domain-containing protein [Bacteroidota bacterium]
MKRFLSIVIFLLSTAIIFAQANVRSGSTTNPEIENLGGFKPDITTFTPDNGNVGGALNNTENTVSEPLQIENNSGDARGNFESGSIELTNLIVNIYPNPASDYILIELDQKCIGNISILNLVGNVIVNMEINSLNIRIDLTGLPEGIYFLDIQTDTDRVVKKIKIQK